MYCSTLPVTWNNNTITTTTCMCRRPDQAIASGSSSHWSGLAIASQCQCLVNREPWASCTAASMSNHILHQHGNAAKLRPGDTGARNTCKLAGCPSMTKTRRHGRVHKCCTLAASKSLCSGLNMLSSLHARSLAGSQGSGVGLKSPTHTPHSSQPCASLGPVNACTARRLKGVPALLMRPES